MPSCVQMLEKRGLIAPPGFVAGSVQYEAITGSVAFGVSTDTSDMDVYGFCIPPRDLVFPHLRGEIPGFGRQTQRFNQYQRHHIYWADAQGGKGRSYDLAIYNIVRYFDLCMQGNPNMVDSLFGPANCVLHCTGIGQMVRDNRKLFLHKGCWPRYKGYAYSQLHKIKTKEPEGKRLEVVERYGWDVKFGYHLVRLLNEAEQMLTEHDLDLTRNSEQLKAIRRGEWSLEQVETYFVDKERELEAIYAKSTLRQGPDEEAIKALLLTCLERFWGSLPVVSEGRDRQALREIRDVLDRCGV